MTSLFCRSLSSTAHLLCGGDVSPPVWCYGGIRQTRQTQNLLLQDVWVQVPLAPPFTPNTFLNIFHEMCNPGLFWVAYFFHYFLRRFYEKIFNYFFFDIFDDYWNDCDYNMVCIFAQNILVIKYHHFNIFINADWQLHQYNEKYFFRGRSTTWKMIYFAVRHYYWKQIALCKSMPMAAMRRCRLPPIG